MTMSEEQKRFLKRYKLEKIKVKVMQLFIGLVFCLVWEILGRLSVINSFITSYPSLIIKTIYDLLISGDLIHHLLVSTGETLAAFVFTLTISLIVSILIYSSKTFDRVIDPYLTIFNSLPKVALGPLLIIWVGANTKSVILMAILISIIVSIESISIGFKNTNKNMIKIMKTFGASRWQILKLVVIPSNYKVIINSCKMNIGLCLIGVVMGEFLSSKAGIGYLILYGSQVFNLTLVMSGIVVLLILSITLYSIISLIEKHLD